MNKNPKRKSYLNSLTPSYICDHSLLKNEASVEMFFVNRLIALLGYKDAHIKTKEYIESEWLSAGTKRINYSPDYVLSNKKKIPALVIDAKSPKETITDYIGQVSSYTLTLFRKYNTELFLITNGLKTNLYKIDTEKPLLQADFHDLFEGSQKLGILREYISFQQVSLIKENIQAKKYLTLKHISPEEAKKIFSKCHKKIWNAEKRSPHSAFIEFVKLIFVKLYNDRILHEDNKTRGGGLSVLETNNRFSVRWIEENEKSFSKNKRRIANPINDILFKELFDKIKDDIDKNRKKTIFEDAEQIALKPETIKLVVKELEEYDLFGIDEDLNGRLFETFLNATMRGEELGQYFTPRNIVLLGVYLAELKAERKNSDVVMDASCGTGGFLIEAFTIMRQKIRNNQSYTEKEKGEYINHIARECIFGIDAAKDPNLYKIARINMFLHGDGGSHIYYGDGLDHSTEVDKTDGRLLQRETEDMIDSVQNSSFDVVLTNPPFSMWYELRNLNQKRILEQYSLLIKEGNEKRNRLRGSALFIERYYNLLKPGGKLITVIDDTVLESDDFLFVRNFIRKKFIIKAIISLHGDAFQMAKARVKTSLLFIQKKASEEETQPNAFMYSSLYVGVDDLPITTSPNKVEEARKKAIDEIENIVKSYKEFESGKRSAYSVSPNKLQERLDVKFCTYDKRKFHNNWKSNNIVKIENIMEVRNDYIDTESKQYKGNKHCLLKIQYDGRCSQQEERFGRDIRYPQMISVNEGDLAFSEYNTFNGAIGYITKDIEGYLASGSYVVLKGEKYYDSLYLWHLLRKIDFRTMFLVYAIGMGRKTISWDTIKNIEVPLLDKRRRKGIADRIIKVWENERKSKEEMVKLDTQIIQEFALEADDMKKKFEGMKPPK